MNSYLRLDVKFGSYICNVLVMAITYKFASGVRKSDVGIIFRIISRFHRFVIVDHPFLAIETRFLEGLMSS